MLRKVVGITFVTIWLTLLGVELVENVGLFKFSDQDVDRSVDAALSSFGKAAQFLNDAQWIASDPVSPLAESFPSYRFPFPKILSSRLMENKLFFLLREDVPTYKLHRAFLI